MQFGDGECVIYDVKVHDFPLDDVLKALRDALLHLTPAADCRLATVTRVVHLEAPALKATMIADAVDEAHTELGKLFEGPN